MLKDIDLESLAFLILIFKREGSLFSPLIICGLNLVFELLDKLFELKKAPPVLLFEFQHKIK